MRNCLFAFSCGLILISASSAAEIRGRVVDANGDPVVLSSATLTLGGKPDVRIVGQLETGGLYRFAALPEGEYDVIIKAYLFRDVVIRGIDVAGSLFIVPTLRIEFEGYMSCDVSNSLRPIYYRLSGTTSDTGVLSGRIVNGRNGVIAGAALSLFQRGFGRLASTTTNQSGAFSFPSLRPAVDYWITVSATGYFSDEMTGLAVQTGFDSVYEMRLESCPPGKCQPHLKTIPTIEGCA